MRVAVAGTRSFGAAVTTALYEAGHDVVCVFAPLGDKTGAAGNRLPDTVVFDPDRFEVLPVIDRRGIDLLVAAHSHSFIGAKSRAATRLGAIGYHPSLLPRHRGRDAVRWTVHMGDPIAGGSVYWLDNNVDGGPIAAQDWCHVRPGDTASTLWKRELFPMGVRLLVRAVADLEAGLLVAVPQDERVASWEPSWEREPLFRPELPELGSPAGMRVIASREQLEEIAR